MKLGLLEDFYKCLDITDLDELIININIFSFILPIFLFKINFDEIKINKLINENLSSFKNIILLNVANRTDDYLNEFLKLCNFSNENIFKFIITELIDNIFDHAHSNNAYVIGCCKKGYFDVIIVDNGITIPHSLELHDFTFKNDGYAILNAIDGNSTKNNLGYYERGFGLNNSFSLMTQGGDNSILLASRNGIIFSKKDKIYKIDNSNKSIDGTIIGLRFDLNFSFKNLYDIIRERYDVDMLRGV